MIDLRSDTVTQPTPEMRAVIAAAPVGDDVYHDDPTVLALEERVAAILGKDEAIYMPTGTMTNQVALRTHTSPGDIVLASAGAHIDSHELGAANAISGLTIHQLAGAAGTFTAEQVRAATPAPPPLMPQQLFQPVTLVAAENTHNGAGGTIWPLDQITDVTATAHDLGLATHLDGARLWNAAAATGIAAAEFAAGFDTVSVCFSKGLGAPMGSALAGSTDLIATARRMKQMLGGGFRQAGMMAAGALYALENHRARLVEDHDNAARLARGIAEIPGLARRGSGPATNILYFAVESMPAYDFSARCSDQGVALLALSADTIRVVTHLGVDRADIDQAIEVIAAVATSEG
jgi:threonine aldolase